MSKRNLGIGVLCVVAAGLLVWSVASPSAHAQYSAARKQAGAATAAAGGKAETADKTAKPEAASPGATPKLAPPRPPIVREVTMTGRIGDLHSVMTQTYAADDRAQATADAIKAGLPPVLETVAQGLVLLGMEGKSPAEKLIPFAYQEAQVKGKLYYRSGVRYLDIISVEKAPPTPAATTRPALRPTGRARPAPGGANAGEKKP